MSYGASYTRPIQEPPADYGGKAVTNNNVGIRGSASTRLFSKIEAQAQKKISEKPEINTSSALELSQTKKTTDLNSTSERIFGVGQAKSTSRIVPPPNVRQHSTPHQGASFGAFGQSYGYKAP